MVTEQNEVVRREAQEAQVGGLYIWAPGVMEKELACMIDQDCRTHGCVMP
jgi:hypothetical protein